MLLPKTTLERIELYEHTTRQFYEYGNGYQMEDIVILHFKPIGLFRIREKQKIVVRRNKVAEADGISTFRMSSELHQMLLQLSAYMESTFTGDDSNLLPPKNVTKLELVKK